MSIRNLENSKLKLKKDGVIIDVDNFRLFIKTLGYEILEKVNGYLFENTL